MKRKLSLWMKISDACTLSPSNISNVETDSNNNKNDEKSN